MLNTVWTNTAKRDLKQIYNYIKNVKKSPQGALNVVNDIIEASATIIYFEQYQKDEINNTFRRIIIRHYKIVYDREGDDIVILRVFSTYQNPSRLINDV